MKITGMSVGLLDATVLCLVWLAEPSLVSAQLAAPEVVTAASGGSVTVSCQYDLWYRTHTKYWCRGKVYDQCDIVQKTPRNRANDRISIVDDREAGVFTVTMTSLSDSDEDVYWCVIATFGRNVHTRVRLLVSHADAERGGTVSSETTAECPESDAQRGGTETGSSETTAEDPESDAQRGGTETGSSETTAEDPRVVTPTTTNWTLEQEKVSWWATLRWILFVSMLCCLVSTHVAAWRMEKNRRHVCNNKFTITTL